MKKFICLQFFYCETSAKENIGIDELLEWTIDEAIKKYSFKSYSDISQNLEIKSTRPSTCFFF